MRCTCVCVCRCKYTCIVSKCSCTCSTVSSQNMPPVSAHYFEGRDVCLNIQLLSCVCLIWFVMLHTRLTITITAEARRILDEWSFAEHVLWEIRGACVNTKVIGVEATCIASGDRGWPHVSTYWECMAKPWWVASKQSYSDFVCTCLRMHSMAELN